MITAGQITKIKFNYEFNFKLLTSLVLYDSTGSRVSIVQGNNVFDYGLDPADATIVTLLADYLSEETPVEVTYHNDGYVTEVFAETQAAYDAAVAAAPDGAPTQTITRYGSEVDVPLRPPAEWMMEKNYFLQTLLNLTTPQSTGGAAFKTSHALFQYAAAKPAPPELTWNGTELSGDAMGWSDAPAVPAEPTNHWMASAVSFGNGTLTWRISRIDDGFSTQFAFDKTGASPHYGRLVSDRYYRTRFADGSFGAWLPLTAETAGWVTVSAVSRLWNAQNITFHMSHEFDLRAVDDLRFTFIWHTAAGFAAQVPVAAASAALNAKAVLTQTYASRYAFLSGGTLRAVFSQASGGTLSAQYAPISAAAGAGEIIMFLNLVRHPSTAITTADPQVAATLALAALTPTNQYGTLILEVR